MAYLSKSIWAITRISSKHSFQLNHLSLQIYAAAELAIVAVTSDYPVAGYYNGKGIFCKWLWEKTS